MAAPADLTEPRFSVVIPTYQRRDLVVAAVRALAAQTGPSAEVVVVVDGSTDGTAAALRALEADVRLTVVEQANAGSARARNVGAARARGEVILFLDDDMVAAPDLLEQHDRVLAAGADAVIGHIPVAPETSAGFLARGLARWAEDRRDRLVANGGQLAVMDLLTGQLSVRREVYEALGGLDERFTRSGSFGGEDIDFGRRLFDEGYRLEFAPDAVSWQHYVVGPRAYLRQWHQAGEADVIYTRKHPGDLAGVVAARRPAARRNRYVVRPAARLPLVAPLLGVVARRVAVTAAERWPEGERAERLFFTVRNFEYWRGVRAAGGFPAPRPFRVLCYHAVRDLGGAPRLEPYGVPAEQLRRQLRLLRRAGWRFVSSDEALAALDGGGLPRRSLLVTFDDCYDDLLEAGLPVLQSEGVPALAFAVADQIGRTNQWDVVIGAPELALLDAAGLRQLQASGVEVGVHGATHRPLAAVPEPELTAETSGARETLRGLGLRARAFAYPYGVHDAASRRSVAGSGVEAAFTVTPGLAQAGSEDRYAVPRIEVHRADGAGPGLLLKVAAAGRLPDPRPATKSALRPAVRAGRRLVARARARAQGAQTR